MPCVAADDHLCHVTDCSLTCVNDAVSRHRSDRRLTPPALSPSIADASKTSSFSTPTTSRRRLPMWRSLSSLWKKSSSGVASPTPTAGPAASDDVASDTQQCSFVRAPLFRLISGRSHRELLFSVHIRFTSSWLVALHSCF